MGGPSAEREISLITGQAVCDNLDRKKYQVLPLEYGRDFKFYWLKGQKRFLADLYDIKKKTDIVFNALHGTYGEDGGVQGMFEASGIKYTGSKVLSSALCMNKAMTGRMYYACGLPHPPFLDFKEAGWKNNRNQIVELVKKNLKYPAVLKPVEQGSAVGVHIVKNEAELTRQINQTIKEFGWMMVQKYIKGEEATVGVLEIKNIITPLPPTHIKANLGKFYDYKSKYAPGGSTHICPADFAPKINQQMQSYAIQAHQLLGCHAMSRTDFFVQPDDQMWLIETNTIPGMTSTSLLPEAAGKMGISFSQMLDVIIEAS